MKKIRNRWLKKYGLAVLCMGIVFSVLSAASISAAGPDAGGVSTGSITDIPAVTAGKPTLEEVDRKSTRLNSSH